MSLKLYLLPYYADGKTTDFSRSVIEASYTDDNDVNNCTQLPVEENFESYLSRDGKDKEPHYGITLHTPYGDRLTYTHAGELKPFILGAAGAYINALDDMHKVALYWH
jgi:hypothetical protein